MKIISYFTAILLLIFLVVFSYKYNVFSISSTQETFTINEFIHQITPILQIIYFCVILITVLAIFNYFVSVIE